MGGLKIPARRGWLLKSGQTTQYSSELDDGYYQRGLARAYAILTTGQYAGTKNVDLAHYAGTAGHIAFNNTTHKITDSDSGLALFKTGDVITTDDVDNPGPFTITTGNVAAEIVCTGATFVSKTPTGVVTIFKREAISNACVLDLNTGLMWAQTIPLKFGAASDGKVPWTGALYDAFALCAAANAASLGGYTDWRVPNILALYNIAKLEAPGSPAIDTAVFTNMPSTGYLWSSTTVPAQTTNAMTLRIDYGVGGSNTKTSTSYYVLLVRG